MRKSIAEVRNCGSAKLARVFDFAISQFRSFALVASAAAIILASVVAVSGEKTKEPPKFQTSDRCVACHNGITTQAGEQLSFGFDWRTSMMANSSRDPYWQASVKREIADHPEARAEIEDECSVCHMPVVRYGYMLAGKKGQILSHLPIDPKKKDKAAADGVSCSVCHQVSPANLGKRESFNGRFIVDPATIGAAHAEYGPFAIEPGLQRIMQTSSVGFQPTEAAHIRDSALCATCHTLYTKALGANGAEVGSLPEQMPYQEWLHSDYPSKNTCQSCHMPEVHGMTAVTAVLGTARSGARRHTFIGANFIMQRILGAFPMELGVAAPAEDFNAAAERTIAFLQNESAHITITSAGVAQNTLRLAVRVENRSGHKLPTAYPSRRVWLHLVVRDAEQRVVFESGALNPDGSIAGNDNDADPLRFEPHYREITRGDQVQIFEPILKDSAGRVTTGLLAAVGYLKDNRLLPAGFRKSTADPDIAVVGEAASDPDFTDTGSTTRYAIALGDARGALHVTAELWYQPIGFRWAHNLEKYDSEEARRFVRYYGKLSATSAVRLAATDIVRQASSAQAITTTAKYQFVR